MSVPAHTAALLSDVASRLGSSLDLRQTLAQVTQAVVDRLGFGLAVLNLVTVEGDLEVVTVAGSDEVRDELVGQVQSAGAWEQALAVSQPRGRLRFLDGRTSDQMASDVSFYVPDIAIDPRPDAWHPLDALFAPLYGGDGALLGVLSVDLPWDGMRPDPDDYALLEVFVVQASLAIDHARLYSDLQDSLAEQQRVQAELRHRALHDPLTGLANRELLLDRLDQALGRARRDNRVVAVLFLDIDRFKLVNDSLGHGVGDELLIGLAGLLGEHLREIDTAGRLGGDEFVLVLEDLSGPAEAIAVAERLLIAVREPIQAGGEEVRTSLSIGIALASSTATSSGLLADADAALYRAKAAGRGRWEVFDNDMRSAALAQLSLRRELLDAAADEQFRLFYQPIVDLRTGVHLGYEALLRWQHPSRGLLLPETFLDVLEDSDSDSLVAQWVLGRACADAATWPAAGGPAPFVTVNVSPRQLSRPDLARRVAGVLERTGLPAGRLWIEITEDRPLDPSQDIADVQRLRDLGVHVALDDFGTGYAGLAYLQRLPADTVKIDRVFVSQVDSDPVSRGIVGAVVDLAAVLGLQVVAEGVETEAQSIVLRDLGVVSGQGFLYGEPAPLPSSGPVPVVSTAVLAESFSGELRRLHAALTAAADPQQVAELALQAACRSVGADGGVFGVLGTDGQVRLLTSVGWPRSYVEAHRTFDLDTDLHVVRAMREHRAVWVEQSEAPSVLPWGAHTHGRAVLAFACLPVAGRQRVLGGLVVSWTDPVELAPVLREHLEAITTMVGARLDDLHP